MEILRYIIVFLVVGWGGGLLGGLLFLVTLPLLSCLRGKLMGRIVTATENGIATLLAVVIAYHACGLTGDNPSLGMFALAFVAMMLNDFARIRRAHSARAIAGQRIDEESVTREGIVTTERMNLVCDLLGFAGGLALLPSLSVL